ncbi:hypothetical protein CVT24_002545 [Panaeolus cyanescens]|uniref:RING-type domain-containing protein n=1 Tax=Panaeolus cyanescens TaxID=181874 RepID=A0A409WPP9_9AGAR|nr:hypothetical protein CVT24_002545 [Panaeolus cyanescens]
MALVNHGRPTAVVDARNNAMIVFGNNIKRESKDEDLKRAIVHNAAPAAKKASVVPQTRVGAPLKIEKSASGMSDMSVQEIANPGMQVVHNASLAKGKNKQVVGSSLVPLKGNVKVKYDDDDEDQEIEGPAQPLSGYEQWRQKQMMKMKVKNAWKDLREGRKVRGLLECSDDEEEKMEVKVKAEPVARAESKRKSYVECSDDDEPVVITTMSRNVKDGGKMKSHLDWSDDEPIWPRTGRITSRNVKEERDEKMPGAYRSPSPVAQRQPVHTAQRFSLPTAQRLPAPAVRAPVKFEEEFKYFPVASGSNVRLPVASGSNVQLPVASGSNVRLPDIRQPAKFPLDFGMKSENGSDDELDGGDEDDEDDEEGDDDDDNMNGVQFGYEDGFLNYAQDLVAQQKAEELMNDIGIHVAPMHDPADLHGGDFYGRGRDLYVGPQAKADDIDKFLVMAGNAENFDGNASVENALQKLGLKSQAHLLPGVTVSLMPHQLIGVAWMLEKERGPLKGGCLADDMGLGKTVQMISLMMMNPSQDPKKKTTLILAPLALLDQWKMEIEMKTDADLKVLIYHGQSRPRRTKDILEYDVVLTTYSTMAAEWPDYEKQAKLKAKACKKKRDDFIVSDSDEDLHTKVKKRKQECGPLFQIEWYRISLDEGQNIRNRMTRASRAISEMKATYRWVMTGTPIINGLTDCYGYIRFLKIRPWYDWTEFNIHICRKEKKQPALAVTRLQAIIKTYQIRRTKNSELDGKRLIELPPKEIDVTKLEFTEDERSIYTMVEARSQATFNRFLRAGTVLKNYHQVLVLLLRLRQICSHPCLIQEEVVAFVPREDVDNSRPELATELTRARRLVSQEFVDEVKAWLKNRVLQRMAAEKQSTDAALEDEDCPICFELMNDTAVFTECKHMFCKDCIHGVIDNPHLNGNGNEDNVPACPKCRRAISKEKLFTRSAFEPTDKELRGEVSEDECTSEDDMDVEEDDDDDASYGKGRSRPSRSTRRKVVYDDDDDDDDMSDFIVESDEDEEEKDARRAMKKRIVRATLRT